MIGLIDQIIVYILLLFICLFIRMGWALSMSIIISRWKSVGINSMLIYASGHSTSRVTRCKANKENFFSFCKRSSHKSCFHRSNNLSSSILKPRCDVIHLIPPILGVTCNLVNMLTQFDKIASFSFFFCEQRLKGRDNQSGKRMHKRKKNKIVMISNAMLCCNVKGINNIFERQTIVQRGLLNKISTWTNHP
jgi:hypothetical protein